MIVNLHEIDYFVIVTFSCESNVITCLDMIRIPSGDCLNFSSISATLSKSTLMSIELFQCIGLFGIWRSILPCVRSVMFTSGTAKTPNNLISFPMQRSIGYLAIQIPFLYRRLILIFRHHIQVLHLNFRYVLI